jgi:aminoglycoside 6-adenylyltransferase
MYEATFSDSNYDNLWKAIFTACALFKITALQVGNHFTFIYKEEEEKEMIEYLNRIKNLQSTSAYFK